MQWVRLRDSHTPHHTTVITTRTSRTARACLTLYTHAVVQRVYYLYGRATSLALLLALGTASVVLCGVHPFLLFFAARIAYVPCVPPSCTPSLLYSLLYSLPPALLPPPFLHN